MHELSIASSVIEIALRYAAGRRVNKVVIKVGHLRQVVPSALHFSFEIATQDTLAEGAVLEIESIPAVGVCRQCRVESVLKEFPLQCGACFGFDLEIVAGEELTVDSLELEEVESGTFTYEDDGSGRYPGCQ